MRRNGVITELANSGMPKMQVKQLAINAAAATKATQEAILETMFPSGSIAAACLPKAGSTYVECSQHRPPRCRVAHHAAHRAASQQKRGNRLLSGPFFTRIIYVSNATPRAHFYKLGSETKVGVRSER